MHVPRPSTAWEKQIFLLKSMAVSVQSRIKVPEWVFSLCWSQWLIPCLPQQLHGHTASSCSCHHYVHEMGNGFLPPTMSTSLPCTPLVHIINQAPYLLGSHLQSCNVAVEIFTVTISCEGGFPCEWCRSLQDVEVRYESPSPEDKIAKPHWGKKSAGKLLLIYMELKFKHCCGRHIVNCDGAFVADMV